MESDSYTFTVVPSDIGKGRTSERIILLLRQMAGLGLRVIRLEDMLAKIRRRTIEECCAALCIECKRGLKVKRDHTWQAHHPDTGHLCSARGLRDVLLAQEEAADERKLSSGRAVPGLLSDGRKRTSA